MADKLFDLQEAIINGSKPQAIALTKELLTEKVSPQQILNEGLIEGMSEVGDRFKCGDYFVPEMLIAARAMQSSMDLLRPVLVETGVEPIGTIVLGTVRGDLHDIGKNLTGMLLEGAGFKVVDVGVDASAEKFVNAVKENNAQLVGMSALLTTTMTYTREVIKALEAAGLRKKVKVIVGGAPITEDWAAQIGADGFAVDAATGADRCKELLAELNAA
ncbi:MAG: cobalamin-binding protein [Caldilinea sp. CFX5]|nr:cobalamin-binding protein [Caldilinea sp. CFX5]